MVQGIARDTGRTRVRFDRPADVKVSVAFNFYVSVFALTCDGVKELGRRSTRSPVAKAAASLTPHEYRAVLPIVAPGHSLSPDCLSPGNPTQDTELEAELQRLHALSAEEIREDLERTFGDSPMPAHWAQVWQEPRCWAHGFASAIERFGAALEPEWRRSAEQRDREAERIGGAVMRGVGDVALASSHPRGTLRGTVLEFPDADPVELDAGGRQIALTPMIGQPRSAPCNLDLPSVLWFGYPLPASSGELVSEGSPAEELDALLTPIRARLLRTLEEESSMHTLASVLTCSAANATHHCDALVKAGLLRRRREGKTVLVSRTARGDQLLDVYSASV